MGEQPENGEAWDGSAPLSGDEIVISGISGQFPKSDNVKQFMDNLYNKVDMTSHDGSFSFIKHPAMPKHFGRINGLNKFDAQFFRVTYIQATVLDPLSMKLMENAYSAIFDAGINPATLSGQKLGIFVGTFSDSNAIHLYNVQNYSNFIISGCSKSMAANRISYWINAKGPSYSVDSASASSMTCLELAYNSIKSGECEAAIVGGANMFSYPKLCLNLSSAGLLCLDGKTKCFDKKGDGYVRSEAVNVIFLQKAKDAKRIYCEVLHAKEKYFLRPDAQFLSTHYSKELQQFLKEFYSEVNLSPEEVEYVEAYGSGIAEADGNELEAIGQIFGEKHPVNIGSVTSNMGNAEYAAGTCAVAKLCLAYKKGKIPANLHYNEPQDHIPAVRDGKIHVLTEHLPFDRGYTAINSLSYNGSNYHVLLKGHFKARNHDKYKCSIPYLVPVSGRQEQAINTIIDTLKNSTVDSEQIGLLHNIFEHSIPGHTARGFTIIENNQQNVTTTLGQGFEYYSGKTPPVWFMYSGMGSQWSSMGADLMRIPIFAAAIERCHNVLETFGLDIVKIITDPDKEMFTEILNCFVGIAAIQIGLTDVLKALGVVPDKIIGHSAGEVACAYADECLTLEESILASYYRGLVSAQTKFVRGSMAAIGLGYDNILPLCPPEIQVACHNSAESATISGPAEEMKQFVSDLTNRGIFAKEVPSANIAYHSKYIADAGPPLLSRLKEVITEPKLRSNKWLSTSVPQDKWETVKYASAEYITNNLLNPVYFEETARMIPDDAIVVEIAPHGLLQAIVKRSHKDCTHIPLTRRGHPQPVTYLLEALGKLYQAGINLKVNALYPKIDFPVSTETPTLSDLVVWEHSEEWMTHKIRLSTKEYAISRNFIMNIHDDEFKYLEGNIIDGMIVFPESALLVLVWETLAMYNNVNYQNMSVVFKNIKFYKALEIIPQEQLKLHITIQKGLQRFEVTHEESQIISGFINGVGNAGYEQHAVDLDQEININSNDVYRILGLKGYLYKNDFQSVHSMNITRNTAQVIWNENWVTFLDSLLQFNILTRDHGGISSPKHITSLSIDVKLHDTDRVVVDGFEYYNAKLYDMYEVTRCGGVNIQGIVFNNKPTKQTDHILLKRSFVPYFSDEIIDLDTALHISLQIVAENVSGNEIKVSEINSTKDAVLSRFIKEIVEKMTLHNIKFNSIHNNNWRDEIMHNTNLFVVNNADQDVLEELQEKLGENCSRTNELFILCVINDFGSDHPKLKDFNVITCMWTGKQKLMLLRKANKLIVNKTPKGQCGNYYYLVDDAIVDVKNVKLTTTGSGNFDDLVWAEAPLSSNNTSVQVYFSGLSHKDCQNIEEQSVNADNSFGMDFSGYNIRNERVMGVVSGGALGSTVDADPYLLWPVPEQWSLEDAATVPLPYIHAYYCLMIKCQLSKGQSVLVTGGTGALGQAVISICLSLGCTVYTTVSSNEKRRILLQIFPELDEKNVISCSRDAAFGDMVVLESKNRCCDIVINYGSGILREAAMKCVGFSGTFIDISDHDSKENYDFKMCYLQKDRSYKCANISNIFRPEYANDKIELQKLLWDGIAKGIVRPISRVTYIPEEVSRAFRLLASSGHIGRVLIRMKDISCTSPIDVKRRISLIPTAAYVVVCDESGLGIELIDCLITRGARKIVLHVNSNTLNNYIQLKLLIWKKADVEIILSSDNLVDVEACQSLIETANTLGPVDGIFIIQQGQGIRNIERQRDFKNNCKEASVTNLNVVCRNKIASLSYFVIISTNVKNVWPEPEYDISERICEERDNIELPALLFRIQFPNQFEHYTSEVITTIFSALETSLKRNHKNVIVHILDKQNNCGFSTQIAKCLNVTNLSDIDENKTIRDFTLDNNKIEEIRKHIEKLNNITFSTKELEQMTIASLKILEENKSTQNIKFKRGLGAFYNSIAEDQYLTAEPIITMQTQLSNFNERDEELDPNDMYLIMIPGFEGHHKIFTALAERLKIRAVTVQLDVESNDDSIQKIASSILGHIKNRFQLHSKFYLMGYSFGVNVALELAALMEKEGRVGVVYCLDSSPDAIRVNLNAYIGNLNIERLQDVILKHIFCLITGEQCHILDNLEKISNWTDKVDEFMSKLQGICLYPHQFVRSLVEAVYRRIMLAKEYDPCFKLNSELVLLKGICHPKAEHLPKDYNLSKYSTRPVQVFNIESEHAQAPYDCKVANLINRFFDSNVIEQFNSSNLCDFYYK